MTASILYIVYGIEMLYALSTGCSPGFFGRTCNEYCSDSCADNICNEVTGECYQCKPHFTGQFCETCVNGTLCNKECLPQCLSCSRESKCIECKLGFFGDSCKYACLHGCWDNICNQQNGTCRHGCKNDFEGEFCQGCAKGKYGTNCSVDCPLTCKDKLCEQTSGKCLIGCMSAMYGSQCEIKCPENCEQCISNISCQRCKTGYRGKLCNIRCYEGCRTDCYQDGTCTDCVDQYYGDFCNVSCSRRCLNGHCNYTGSCYDCGKGFFGDRCERNCPSHCCNSACEKDGSCVSCKDEKENQWDLERIAWISSTSLLVMFSVLLIVYVMILRRGRAATRSVNKGAHQDRPSDTENSDGNDAINMHLYSGPYERPLAQDDNSGNGYQHVYAIPDAGEAVASAAEGSDKRRSYEQLEDKQGTERYSALKTD